MPRDKRTTLSFAYMDSELLNQARAAAARQGVNVREFIFAAGAAKAETAPTDINPIGWSSRRYRKTFTVSPRFAFEIERAARAAGKSEDDFIRHAVMAYFPDYVEPDPPLSSCQYCVEIDPDLRERVRRAAELHQYDSATDFWMDAIREAIGSEGNGHRPSQTGKEGAGENGAALKETGAAPED